MDEDVAAYWTARRADAPPECALFAAIIRQAVEDATRPAGRWRDDSDRQDADAWLRYSETFSFYAGLAGVDDTEALRERIVARLDAAQARQNRQGEAISGAEVPTYLLAGRTVLTAPALGRFQ
ncbi:MAG: hypothetical protein M0Z99_26820 [Betaproteobacteria bacterium]|nr:hypothetical protein [Betaproteobacteria bacterium]